jgi:hypothetical protein
MMSFAFRISNHFGFSTARPGHASTASSHAFVRLDIPRFSGRAELTDSFLFARRQQIAALAARHQVPTIHSFREYVAAGGLMSYGASFVAAWRQSGTYVGRILNGVKRAARQVRPRDKPQGG